MIDLELERRYFVTLEDGSSEFEYALSQLIPHKERNDYDLSEYCTLYTDGNSLTMTNWDGEETTIYI